METCGDCAYWDTTGFGLRNSSGRDAHKQTIVGKCGKVALHWSPESPDKMIAMSGIEHVRWPASELISVITRREFGCNQWEERNEKS